MSGATLAPDRRSLPPVVLAGVAFTTAASLALATQSLTSEAGLEAAAAGFAAGLLAVLALRSVSVRLTARWMCAVGSVLMLRFGLTPTEAVNSSTSILAWILATAAALVISASVTRWQDAPAGAAPATRPYHATGRLVVIIASLAAGSALALGPIAAARFSSGSGLGTPPRFGPGSLNGPMVATDFLDMTDRPRLSDALVMTVRTDVPTFWRVQTFDEWDGAHWTRRNNRLRQVPDSGRVRAGAFDLAATNGEQRVDEFRIEAPFAAALPAAPAPVKIQSPRPVVQGDDASLLPTTPLGRGASYSVTTRAIPLSDAIVRAAGATGEAEIPEEVAADYAGRPVATDRVRALAQEITGDLDNSYDKVRAIERWLAENTEYSLDAPLSPEGRDVVDHFLFRSQLGWCEQVSSSMTVLLRLSGVPARLATGYVPEGRDALTGRYRVLERNAHAWTEVWFPGLGWVPFDPTASVPLAPDAGTAGGLAGAIASYGAWVMFAIAAITAFGSQVVGWLRRRLASRRTRRRNLASTAAGADDWLTSVEVRLDDVGRRWHRSRDPAETTTAYGRALGDRTGDRRLDDVGAAVDRQRFSGAPLPDDERATVVAVLESAPDPPEPGGPGHNPTEMLSPPARR